MKLVRSNDSGPHLTVSHRCVKLKMHKLTIAAIDRSRTIVLRLKLSLSLKWSRPVDAFVHKKQRNISENA